MTISGAYFNDKVLFLFSSTLGLNIVKLLCNNIFRYRDIYDILPELLFPVKDGYGILVVMRICIRLWLSLSQFKLNYKRPLSNVSNFSMIIIFAGTFASQGFLWFKFDWISGDGVYLRPPRFGMDYTVAFGYLRLVQWNLSVTTTSIIKFITCDLFSDAW